LLENHYNNVQGTAGTNGKSNRRIVGWKANGQFLGCTERTARRWQRRALPHHLSALRGYPEFSTYRDDPEFREIVARLP